MAKAFAKLQQATVLIARKGQSDPEEAAAAATDYLQLFGYVALGYMWLRMAKMAQGRLSGGDADAVFYEAKLRTARFYMQRTLADGQCTLPGAECRQGEPDGAGTRSILTGSVTASRSGRDRAASSVGGGSAG